MSSNTLAVMPAPSGLAAQTQEDWDEVKRLFRGMIGRNKKATDAEIDAAILACKAMGFNPILNHVDLIDGKVYVTHKGLWALAHRSGMLDGIEVLEQGETRDHYTARVAIYRKDMRYPFAFSGRYPKKGRNAQYGPEMALVRAECMALRRAFDVTLPVVEEINWHDGREHMAPSDVQYTVEVVEPAQATTPAALPAGQHDLMGWTEFWSWAKPRGYGDRKSLDTAIGKSTSGMTPGEIQTALQAGLATQEQPRRQRRRTVPLALAVLGDLSRSPETRDEAARWVMDQANDVETIGQYHLAISQALDSQTAEDLANARLKALGIDDAPMTEPAADAPWYDDPTVAPLLEEDAQA